MTDGEGYNYDDDHVFDYMDELDEERCDICGQCPEECVCHECGMMPDGSCMLIGTEFCDWECGRLAADRIAAMKEAASETGD